MYSASAVDIAIVQKLAEVRQIAGSVEHQVVEEAQEVLELILEASIAAPVSTAVAEVSEAPVQVTQTSNLPLIIPSPVSPKHQKRPLNQSLKRLS